MPPCRRSGCPPLFLSPRRRERRQVGKAQTICFFISDPSIVRSSVDLVHELAGGICRHAWLVSQPGPLQSEHLADIRRERRHNLAFQVSTRKIGHPAVESTDVSLDLDHVVLQLGNIRLQHGVRLSSTRRRHPSECRVLAEAAGYDYGPLIRIIGMGVSALVYECQQLRDLLQQDPTKFVLITSGSSRMTRIISWMVIVISNILARKHSTTDAPILVRPVRLGGTLRTRALAVGADGQDSGDVVA